MCGEQLYSALLSLLWVETVFYGLYVALFAGAVYMLVYRRPNVFYLSTSIALFLFTTAYIGLELARILVAPATVSSSYLQDSSIWPCDADANPDERQSESLLWDVLNCVEEGISIAMGFLADGVLVYRCMALWPHRKWITYPLIALLFATVATSLAGIYYSVQIYDVVRNGGGPRDLSQWDAIQNHQIAMQVSANALTSATNILATLLIASRIWYLTRQLEKTLGRKAGVRYRAAMSMIVESGVFLSAVGLVSSCTNNSQNAYLNTIVTDLNLIFTVIAPALLVVRVGMGMGFDSVMESVHENISSDRGNTQTRSIRFASHHTTTITADISHLQSRGLVIQDPVPKEANEAASIGDDSSGHSCVLRQDEKGHEGGSKARKVEVDLHIA